MSQPNNLISTELANIKNNAFDIRGYFNLLFAQLLDKRLLNNSSNMQVFDELITQESLAKVLNTKFIKNDYVILFYAHKPHSIDISPVFPLEKAAHTSVLFCKITDEKISNILNIDCYNFTRYIDIIGERNRAEPNANIKQRLVIDAIDSEKQTLNPLQSPNWYKMNCAIYAFSVVEIMLKLFNNAPENLNNIFDSNGIVSETAKKSLKNNILAGMTDRYVKKIGENYYLDQNSTDLYHQKIRDELAKNYQLQFLKDTSPAQDEQQNIKMTNPAKEQFDKILEELKSKISNFKISGTQHHNYLQIITVAEKLHLDLKQLANDFFLQDNAPTKQFKQNCQEVINKAKPTLNKEPGFLFILLDITKAIANIIIYGCSFGSSNNFFQRSTTNTELSANQLQTTVCYLLNS